MKKTLLIIPLILICFAGYGVYWAFFDMNRLPKGEFISQATSPNGNYTIKAYISNGGATTDYAVLGELIFNKQDRRPKNIYWNYHESKIKIMWLNNDTVQINGHKLKVPNETYDFRKH